MQMMVNPVMKDKGVPASVVHWLVTAPSSIETVGSNLYKAIVQNRRDFEIDNVIPLDINV